MSNTQHQWYKITLMENLMNFPAGSFVYYRKHEKKTPSKVGPTLFVCGNQGGKFGFIQVAETFAGPGLWQVTLRDKQPLTSEQCAVVEAELQKWMNAIQLKYPNRKYGKEDECPRSNTVRSSLRERNKKLTPSTSGSA